MQLILEAGVTGLVIAVVFTAALAARATGRSTSSTSWVLALLALGQIGQSLGQRAVRDAVLAMRGDDIAAIVAQGSAEASANLLLAGIAALVILAVGAARDRAA